MINVGIVGMGVIGRHVAGAITKGIPGVALTGVTVRDPSRAHGHRALGLEGLIRESDLIVEAATQDALREIAPSVLAAGKHLMVLSVGGLVGALDEWARLSEKHGCRILVPSGAIAGLDGMKGAREAGITSVIMETRKPPRSLAGAPWIVQQNIDLGAISKETLVFEGPATEAVKAFPANVNVVAAVSLASIGPDKTRIRRGSSGASPSRSRTCHRRIRARGSSPISRPSPCSGSWGRASRSETSAEDVDALFEQAIAAGGTETRPVADQFYGDRSGSLKDPFGHSWHLSTHKPHRPSPGRPRH